MGGHRGVKAPLAEIHVPARGIGSGAHLFGGAHRAGAGVETDAGKVRAQALTQAALDLLRRTGAVQSSGQLVRLPLGRRVLMVQEVLTHPGLHQFPQLGAHPPVCLAESAVVCLLPRLSRRCGRFPGIPDRSAPCGVDLRHLHSSCPLRRTASPGSSRFSSLRSGSMHSSAKAEFYTMIIPYLQPFFCCRFPFFFPVQGGRRETGRFSPSAFPPRTAFTDSFGWSGYSFRPHTHSPPHPCSFSPSGCPGRRCPAPPRRG